jgi:hypothetical protein
MSIYNLAVDNQQPCLVEVRKSSSDKATEIEAVFISEVLEKTSRPCRQRRRHLAILSQMNPEAPTILNA